MSEQQTHTAGTETQQDASATGGSPQGSPDTEGSSGSGAQQRDPNALPTPDEKHANYEADRKRLAEEHGQK